MRHLTESAFFLICLQDKEPRGIIPLENLCVREVPYTRKPVRNPLGDIFYLYQHKSFVLTRKVFVFTTEDKSINWNWNVVLVSSSTVWSCTTLTVEGRRSKRVKQRRTAGWWRGSTSPTPSVLPAQRSETPGSKPSGWTTHTHTHKLSPYPSETYNRKTWCIFYPLTLT